MLSTLTGAHIKQKESVFVGGQSVINDDHKVFI